MTEMERVVCPLCRSERARTAYQLSDWKHGLGGPFILARCRDCGLLYLNPRPPADELARYYPTNYEPYQESGSRWSAPLQLWGLDKRCRTVQGLIRSGRLLDVGCADGRFLGRMRRYGEWELVGIEPDGRAAERARQRGLTVHQRSLAEVDLAAGRFDIVTLWDVLEHVPSPRDALHRAREWLRPAGWLVVRTPDAGSLYARLFGRTWAGLDAPRHQVVFDRSTLTRLLEETGFRVERMWVLSGSHASTVLSCQYWLRATGRRQVWSRLLDNPVVQVLAMPFFWLIDRGGGAAVTVTAQRADKDGLDR